MVDADTPRQQLLAQLEETETRLQETEERWREFVDRTEDLVTQVDGQGKFLYVNEAAQRIFGLAPAACVGKLAFEFIHPEDRERTMASFAEWVGQRVGSASFENRQVSTTGEVHHMLWTINPRYNAEGSMIELWSIARDITERKQAEEELQQHRDRLEQMVQARTQELGATNARLEEEVAEGRRREEKIRQQTEEILELSTPVMQMWEGVVVAPLIGSLDSDRTQRFMEVLLARIVETSSSVALVDITGVPIIDTQTAQNLIETIRAVRLLGARVILTGVRPSIAQTLVHLGIDLPDLETRASLADGLRLALGPNRLSTGGRDQILDH